MSNIYMYIHIKKHFYFFLLGTSVITFWHVMTYAWIYFYFLYCNGVGHLFMSCLHRSRRQLLRSYLRRAFGCIKWVTSDAVLRYDNGFNMLFQVCDSNPCQNGGTCFSMAETWSFFCACSPGFIGDICEGKYYSYLQLFKIYIELLFTSTENLWNFSRKKIDA